MPNWIAEEVSQAGSLIREIDDFTGPRRRTVNGPTLRLTLSQAVPLLEGLAGNTRALAVRQLYQLFGFDEHRQLRWRLEHKLVQALILDHYCPGTVPVTRGLDRHMRDMDRAGVRRSLHREFPDGFFIKSALSDSTGELGDCDRTHLILTDIESGEHPAGEAPGIVDETWIAQERIDMVKEYRVHSLEDQVIEDCTFRRYGRGNIEGEREAPNAYIQAILDKLPNAIIGESLYGWDVGLTPEGQFRIIEANPSGFHPVYKRGFHCSGFYHDIEWGANITARLLRFIEKVDGVQVVVDPDAQEFRHEHKFYSDVVYWQERLKTEP
jgi:hypothetical protein